MAKENSILTTVLVSLVVAVVASLATVSLTGNAILSGGNSTGPTTFSGTNWLQAMFQGTVNAGGIGLRSVDGRQFELQSVQGNQNTFIIYDRNANQYRMVINGAGNVGIGKTNPQNKLDVAGNINVDGNLYAYNGMIGTRTLNSSYITTGNILANSLHVGSSTGVDIAPGKISIWSPNNSTVNGTYTVFTAVYSGYLVMSSGNGIQWKCGPNNVGVWTCSRY